MGRNSFRKQTQKRFEKIIGRRLKGKIPVPKCPRHGVPYQTECSPDPVSQGGWKHYFCRLCREERP